MAYELKSVFEVQDRMSAKVRKITQEVNKLDIALKRVASTAAHLNSSLNSSSNALGHVSNSYRIYNNAVNNSNNTINRNTNIINHNTNAIHNNITQISHYSSAANSMRNSISKQSSALDNLRSMLLGVTTAYLGAQGAVKAFSATIGAAAKYEQAEVAVKAIFNDNAASKAYLDMVGKMAIDSPLLNSGEMLSSSKTLVAMTKNVEELGKAWSIIERLMVLDPTQGTEGAAFALKEMWQGDALSMVERFGLSKKDLNVIKKLSIPKQIAEINKLLDGMGITQKTVNAMGETTLGYWAQLQERAEKFGRQIGNMSNSKLGKVLGDIITKLDNADLDGIAARFDAKLASITERAINIGKFLWEWREPIIYVAGAISAAMTALVGIGIITALANPISLIAAGIASAAVGMKALYDHSESFRGIISGIVGIIQGIGSLLGPIVSDFFTTLNEYLSGSLFTGILDRNQAAVNLAVGFGSAIKSSMEFAGGAIQKVNDFITTLKEQFSGGLFTGILGRDQGAVQAAVTTANLLRGAFEKIGEVINAFKAGGVSGVLATILPPSMLEDVNRMKESIGTFVSYLMERWTAIQPTIDMLKIAFQTASENVVAVLSTLWNLVGPILSVLGNALSILGDVAIMVFNNIIAPAITFSMKLFSLMWTVVGPILELLGACFKVLGTVIMWLWNTIVAPFVDYWTSGLVAGLNVVMPVLDKVGGMFKTVGGWISTAASYVSNFADTLKKIKIPDWVQKLGGKAVELAQKFVPGNYHGLSNVPYDGYTTRLHKGERVLTAQENKEFSNGKGGNGGGGITITGNTFNVREDSDIEKIAMQLAKLMEKEAVQFG